MSYLLDTNAAVALIKGKPVAIRERYRREQASGAHLVVSSVVLYELWYGVAKSDRVKENTQRLHVFMSGEFDVAAFEEEDAVAAGYVRAKLEAAGTPIGPYDLLIAGQALHRRLTLVTANASEFARVPDLRWEDWTE